MKKILPILLLIVMAVIAVSIRRCNNTSQPPVVTEKKGQPANTTANAQEQVKFDRSTTNLFFTKHAKCRMKCRHISQQEVKDILVNGTINYNKSDLSDPRGPSYALEGRTKDGQKVRIIFAPRKRHLTVVTVMDLEREYVCNC
ncbi:DUF4258 domain-containing protein [Segetibacter koreensis]|uniref:DUF4258 domain-containing protein n=1 Tax=Segetibacter koreensis TaxID=398037 RepID=UPI00146E4AF5|nr:DUF4258 domain-containing protein [Segetibacter koreensis]